MLQPARLYGGNGCTIGLVIGVGTWRLSSHEGVEDTRIVRADGPVEAVEQAIAAAEGARA